MSEEKTRKFHTVRRWRLSPMCSAQSSTRPRAARTSINFGKCLSSRRLRVISSPMMMAPQHRKTQMHEDQRGKGR